MTYPCSGMIGNRRLYRDLAARHLGCSSVSSVSALLGWSYVSEGPRLRLVCYRLLSASNGPFTIMAPSKDSLIPFPAMTFPIRVGSRSIL